MSLDWVANFDDIPMDSSVPMDAAPSAWQMPAQATSENGGWANFDAFNTDLRVSRFVKLSNLQQCTLHASNLK